MIFPFKLHVMSKCLIFFSEESCNSYLWSVCLISSHSFSYFCLCGLGRKAPFNIDCRAYFSGGKFSVLLFLWKRLYFSFVWRITLLLISLFRYLEYFTPISPTCRVSAENTMIVYWSFLYSLTILFPWLSWFFSLTLTASI